MELYQLQYFLEAARQQNFTRAAARLHLAQAALSEQIRKLEAELGTPLFQRGRRESVLTAAGELLRTHAEALLERAESARRSVQALAGLRGGRFVIGAIPSVSACLLPAALSAFRTQHPQVELVLIEGTSESVAEWVETGRVELGIVQPPIAGSSFEIEPLLTEPFLLLLPASNPLATRHSLSLAALHAESFIFYKGRARDTALAACRSAGFEPHVACESGELETVRALVAAGLGIALLPQLATRRSTPGCALVRIRAPRVFRQLALVTRAGHAPSPAAAAFRPLLRKTCR